MKTNPNEPTSPCVTLSEGETEIIRNYGLTKREHFASLANDDFSSLSDQQKELIVGLPAPDINKRGYATWLANGRAIWKVIQADALIAALNNNK